jgi:N-acetylglucosamine malate deacetylase 1
MIKPDLVVDISSFTTLKMNAIKAFSAQDYNSKSKEPETAISGKDFIEIQVGRCAEMGRQIGVKYSEGFTV